MEIIEKGKIRSLAKERWDGTPIEMREVVGGRYEHFLKIKPSDWVQDFDKLAKKQQNVLIKGQLIRWYDSLSNKHKTKIMHTVGLSEFSSKWYRLSGENKRKLLSCVIE